jgi:hypothetical protein
MPEYAQLHEDEIAIAGDVLFADLKRALSVRRLARRRGRRGTR